VPSSHGWRPGQAVAKARGARFPLVEAGLGKADVRRLSRDQGGDLARIEVEPDALGAVLDRRAEVVAGCKRAGFLYVTLDLEGDRQGSHNARLTALPEPTVRPR